MSLVVAKSSGTAACVVSDMRVTKCDKPLGPIQDIGSMKILILHQKLCVAFAGNVSGALQAIRKLKINQFGSFNINMVIEILLRAHIESLEQVGGERYFEFLVLTFQPTNLYRIWNGVVEKDLSTAYIGDKDAFEIFQRKFFEVRTQEDPDLVGNIKFVRETTSKISLAMKQAIDDGSCITIGNIELNAETNFDGFKYLVRSSGFNFRSVINPTTSTIISRLSDTTDGGYNYSLLAPKRTGTAAIALYFLQGDFGALFLPLNEDEVKIYSKSSYEEFINALKRDTRIEFDGIPWTSEGVLLSF